jgi:pimeloyl-ACP methyl ester carboxylesterase
MLHVHRFTPETKPSSTVMLLHGFMDAGGTWSEVAAGLVARGHEVVAPDFRGFGSSDRVPEGAYYHFADYVADVRALVDAVAADELTIVGHSMGGTVATYFAGARPEALGRLVLMEGVGPPDMAPEIGPQRMRTWLKQLERPKRSRPLDSLESAVSRLAANHPSVPEKTLRAVAVHLTSERNGQLHWAFDPLHRTTSPSLFRADAFRTFLEGIRCPVMFISGGDAGWHPLDEGERLEALQMPLKRVVLEDAGHMMHWTKPAEVADAIANFIVSDAGH